MTSTTTTCDALGRRNARYEDGVRTAGWLYLDSLRPVAELNAANEVTTVFIYGGDVHAPSVMRRGGVTYRFVTDHLGSVRVVVRMSDGEVVERTDYDAWGEIVSGPPRDGMMSHRCITSSFCVLLLICCNFVFACHEKESVVPPRLAVPALRSAAVGYYSSSNLNKAVDLAEETRSRSLTQGEVETVRSNQAAEIRALVLAIRGEEAGQPTHWPVLGPTTFEVERPPGSTVFKQIGLFTALREWHGELRSSGSVDRSGLVARNGAGAVWADLLVHDGPGDPSLRALAAAAGVDLVRVDASPTARIARAIGIARSAGSVENQVAAILGMNEPFHLLSDCIMNLGSPALEEVGRRYKNGEQLGTGPRARENMVRLFAGLALGANSALIDEITPSDAILIDLAGARIEVAKLLGQGERNRHQLREFIVLDDVSVYFDHADPTTDPRYYPWSP